MVDINDPFLIVIAVVVPLILTTINLLFVLYYIQLPPAGVRGCADYTTMIMLVRSGGGWHHRRGTHELHQ